MEFETTKVQVARRSKAYTVWEGVVATLAALPKEERGFPSLHNVAMSLLADAVDFEPQALFDYWRHLVGVLWKPGAVPAAPTEGAA